jgi:hypothetical protein
MRNLEVGRDTVVAAPVDTKHVMLHLLKERRCQVTMVGVTFVVIALIVEVIVLVTRMNGND